MDTPHMACLEQRIDELEQALYTIAGAAALPDPDEGAALEGLRRWVLYQTIEDLRLGDDGAAVLVLGDGHALVLRPVVLADGRAWLLPELRARQDVD